jgi:hypothetical protein
MRALQFGIITTLTFVLFIPSTAHAATQSNYNVSYCDGGTLAGTGENDLTNGRLTFGWCKTSSNKMTTLTVKYEKFLGTNITATFGYEWTNSNGGAYVGRHWDSTGSVVIQASQTWGARFRRNPAEATPNSSYPCMRGLLRANGQVFGTRVVCPN